MLFKISLTMTNNTYDFLLLPLKSAYIRIAGKNNAMIDCLFELKEIKIIL